MASFQIKREVRDFPLEATGQSPPRTVHHITYRASSPSNSGRTSPQSQTIRVAPGFPIRPQAYVLRHDDGFSPPNATYIRAVSPGFGGSRSQRGHVMTYRVHDGHNSGQLSPRSSPPPPPYSPPRPPHGHRPIQVIHETTTPPPGPTVVLGERRQSPTPRYGGSEVEHISSQRYLPGGGFRATETVVVGPRNSQSPTGRNQGDVSPQSPSMQGRPPSPFQERGDPVMTVPRYTTSYQPQDKYPEGASSTLVYSSHVPRHREVRSRPMGMPADEGVTHTYPPVQQQQQQHPQQQQPQPQQPHSQQQHYQQQPQRPQPMVTKLARETEEIYDNQPAPVEYRSPGNDSPTKADPPKTPLSPTSSAAPRPYQLKPTMDSFRQDAAPAGQMLNGSPALRGPGKEAEVDALTDLLIQNMHASADPDFFGMCAKCGKCIMGDDTGCSALDQLFHIECFSCFNCGTGLKGHPFFAMEGNPYCEPCYMNTLEKCSVCSAPITERILRATGKPYHPRCFTCVVCGKSLDGIPFTVDATSQIHCIEDFHRKFAPRCCVCAEPILPDPDNNETLRFVALDRSFHIKCYKCEDCGMQLSSEAEGRGCYPLDDSILCKSCNAKRIQAMTSPMMTEL